MRAILTTIPHPANLIGGLEKRPGATSNVVRSARVALWRNCDTLPRWRETGDVLERAQAGGLDHRLASAARSDDSGGPLVAPAVQIGPGQVQVRVPLVEPGFVRAASTTSAGTALACGGVGAAHLLGLLRDLRPLELAAERRVRDLVAGGEPPSTAPRPRSAESAPGRERACAAGAGASWPGFQPDAYRTINAPAPRPPRPAGTAGCRHEPQLGGPQSHLLSHAREGSIPQLVRAHALRLSHCLTVALRQ
jgi:hypothetical protein